MKFGSSVEEGEGGRGWNGYKKGTNGPRVS